MMWVVRFFVLLIIFLIFDIVGDKIDEEKGKKIGWFGWFCFLIGQFYEMIPWESFFK